MQKVYISYHLCWTEESFYPLLHFLADSYGKSYIKQISS